MSLPAPPSARAAAFAAGILAAQLLASVVALLFSTARLVVPVEFGAPRFAADTSFAFVAGATPTMSAEFGMLPVLLVSAVLFTVLAVRGSRGRLSPAAASVTHWVSVSQSLGITVVIVALLNGATDAATIVPLYALAAGAGMLGWLSDRTVAHEGRRSHLWPYAFLTVLAIVPWGVVALVQVTGLVLGAPASAGVRVLTLVVLAATILWAAAEWAIARPAGPGLDADRAARLRVTSSTALASIPVGAVVVLGLLGG